MQRKRKGQGTRQNFWPNFEIIALMREFHLIPRFSSKSEDFPEIQDFHQKPADGILLLMWVFLNITQTKPKISPKSEFPWRSCNYDGSNFISGLQFESRLAELCCGDPCDSHAKCSASCVWDLVRKVRSEFRGFGYEFRIEFRSEFRRISLRISE